MKVEPVATGENAHNVIMEAQYIRRVELMEMARKRSSTVEENQEADKSDWYDYKFKREEVESKEQKPDNMQDKLRLYEDEDSGEMRNKLSFSINEETGKVIIKIVDQETGEVVREIPPEEMIKKMARIREGCNNLVMDKKV